MGDGFSAVVFGCGVPLEAGWDRGIQHFVFFLGRRRGPGPRLLIKITALGLRSRRMMRWALSSPHGAG